ncbi:MAG: efflux RND transporter periplasmic adaptor subunit [Planctomycetaceae bacterium]
MNRILIILSIISVGAMISSAPWNSSSSRGSGQRVPVKTLETVSDGSAVKPSTSIAPNGAGHPLAGAAAAMSSAAGSSRDYRRELQYDSSILEIRSQLHGVARPLQNAILSSLVPGRIMTIHVAEGSRVSACDPLVSLDDRLAQAQVEASRREAAQVAMLERAELAYQQAERRLSRLEKAALQNATAAFEIEEARSLKEQSRAERDAAREAIAVAEANLTMAEEQLRRNTIYAPFDGVIVQIHQKQGAAVDASLPVVTLASLDTLEVEMYVPSDRFGSIRNGSTVKLSAGAPVNTDLSAKVCSVSPVIDSASNTFRCVLQIDNTTAGLPAGFSVVLTNADEQQNDGKSVANKGLRNIK